ncbi:phage minor capsid protein [Streptosporangium sp. NPDC049248]|uniref:phage minor capsid protein n=1 Tax=Streptosporangium sp. NPDC049248 TaxID=3155651 RepID=UPI003433CC53
MADALEAVEGQVELAYAISAMYADAEEHLFEVLAKAAARGTQPQQAANRFAEVKKLSEQAEKVLKDLEKLASQMLSKGVTQAWEDGFERARQELGRLGEDQGITPGQGAAQLVKEALGLLPPLTMGALRMVNDIYRQVIAEATPLALTGAITRQQATTAALQKMAAKGISGFVDSKDRTWSISAYAEMAARTAMARAANEGHLSTLRDNGRDLVIVSRAPYRCPVCLPWEGKVLSQTGSAGDRQEKNVLTGEPVTVRVVATVEDARQAGLQHPNCKHTFSVYLPGLTKPPPKVDTAGTYDDTQEQRHLERQIRGWKRRAAAAPKGSPEKKAADQHVKAYQAKMREHLDKTGLLRQSSREKVRPDETTEPKALASVKKASSGVSDQTLKKIEKARQELPSSRTDWGAERHGTGDNAYRKDKNGQLLPPKAYERYLDRLLDAGKSLQKDMQKAFDGDAKLAELRKTAESLRGRLAHKEATRDVAKREKKLILDLLQKLRPMGGAVDADKADEATRKQYGRGVKAAPDDWRRLLDDAAKHYPADWHAKTPKGLRVAGKERAFYSPYRDILAMPTKHRDPSYDGAMNSRRHQTAAHELAHRMEANVPGVNEMSYTYRTRRSTRGGTLEQLTDMHDIHPWYAAGTEFTYKDKWANAYTGRSYTSPYDTDPASDGGEVFSTGVEELFGRSSHRFDTGDELQAFVLGVLAVL